VAETDDSIYGKFCFAFNGYIYNIMRIALGSDKTVSIIDILSDKDDKS
jgi:hypothetical protein